MAKPLIEPTDRGLFCTAGDFYIDPWQPVEKAVITHAHADHARWGSRKYLTSERGAPLLRARLGDDAVIESAPYVETRDLNGVRISLHPAGHVLGSAQVRVEHQGEVWVVSGDYKTEDDCVCDAFAPVRCHTFVSECTFGLPIYRWRPQGEVFAEIHAWWRVNQERGRTSVLFAYALGKSQRVLAGLDDSIGPILLHGAVRKLVEVHEQAGLRFPAWEYAGPEAAMATKGRALVIAPPSAAGTPWLRKFGPVSTALASGWMQIRGTRRRRSMDRGFVISDHADWDGLHAAIAATGAENVAVTHGFTAAMQRTLEERGYHAWTIPTRFEQEPPEEETSEE